LKIIKAEITNGVFKLYNKYPELAGIEITYSGEVHIIPTLPEGWVLRASESKIIIFNMGTNNLENGHKLFTFQGVLNVRNCLGASKNAKRIRITMINKKIIWGADKMDGLTDKQESWDSMEVNNESKPSKRKISRVKYESIAKKDRPSIVRENVRTTLYTKGNEYTYINGKNYVGYYHIHIDMGYAMTGQEHSNKSEFLKKIGDIELPLFKRKNLSGKKGKRNMASSTARNATSSTTTSGGGY
jgi:hypothetical protein